MTTIFTTTPKWRTPDMTNETNTGNCNTGDSNTGDCNTGNCNTGDCNTGYSNTGYSNTGKYNTGDWNTGDCNTGDYNTGDCNTGKYNTGDWNTGRWNTGKYNTGDWNTGSFHVGCFNTVVAEKAYYFNKLIDKAEWDAAKKPDWLYEPSPNTWVASGNMTDGEKADNLTYETTGGYLRKNDMKEEWRKAYKSASTEDIQAVRDLPGFDADVFEQITGLDLPENPAPETCEGREIEIDGVTYVLKVKGE